MKTLAKKKADSIISPIDGDTSEEEEYTRIMSTNNPTVVENVAQTSNSSNPDYTELVSVSFTTASIKRKYMCNFLHCEFYHFYIYNLLIHHNPNVTTFNYILYVGASNCTFH